MNRKTVQKINTKDLEMGTFSAKIVPGILADNQEQCRLHI
jgi:hypothetical protein